MIFTYLLSERVTNNRWLGLLSALFLGALNYHVINSAFITTDVPVAFFTTGVVFLSLSFLESGKKEFLITSLIFCGLATATKYNSSLIIVITSIALLIRYYQHRLDFNYNLLILLPAVPALTFAIAMPYAILDSVGFLSGLGDELRHYKVLGHPGATTEPGLRHVLFQLDLFYQNLGLSNAVIATIGVFGVVLYPRLIFALIFPLVIFVFLTTTMKVNFHRNFIQIYPFLGVLFASGCGVIYRLSGLLTSRLRVKEFIALSIVSIIVIFALGPLVYTTWRDSSDAFYYKDTRTKAVAVVNGIGGITSLLVAKDLRVHEEDLRKLTMGYEIKSSSELGNCAPNLGIALMLPIDPSDTGDSSDNKTAKNYYNKLTNNIESGDVLARIGGARLNLDGLTSRPGPSIIIVKAKHLCANP